MPICKKCGTTFPNRVRIEGKQQILSNRKYCLSCSPFKRHNTQDLNLANDPFASVRTCTDCNRVYLYKKSSGHSKTRCNSCKVNNRRFSVKSWVVSYKGGK